MDNNRNNNNKRNNLKTTDANTENHIYNIQIIILFLYFFE